MVLATCHHTITRRVEAATILAATIMRHRVHRTTEADMEATTGADSDSISASNDAVAEVRNTKRQRLVR